MCELFTDDVLVQLGFYEKGKSNPISGLERP
jgi:hypothetical protein